MQRYKKQFFRPFDFIQGDPCGGGAVRYALQSDDYKALSSDALLPALRSVKNAYQRLDMMQKQLLYFDVSYLNDAGHIEGFTLVINRHEPTRYFVSHGINMAGKRAFDAAQQTDEFFVIKFYYSTACKGIEGDKPLARLSSNAAEQFPACIGNKALRAAMQATIGFMGDFDIDKLLKLSINPRSPSAFAEPLPLPEVCSKFDQLWYYMQKRRPKKEDNPSKDDKPKKEDKPSDKEKSFAAREQIYTALFNSLVPDRCQSQMCSAWKPEFIEIFSVDKLQAFRQRLATIRLNETAGTQTMREIYPRLFADVDPVDLEPLSPAKGSAFIGLNPGGFFAQSFSLFRDEEESFEGCLKQLAEAAQRCAQASRKENCAAPFESTSDKDDRLPGPGPKG